MASRDIATIGPLTPTASTHLLGSTAGVTQSYLPPALLRPIRGEVNVQEFASSVSGTDWNPAIAAAIAAASDGDTIILPRATYRLDTRNIAVAKELTFLAAGAVFDIRTAVNATERLFSVTADNVSFIGITFDGTNAPAGNLTNRNVCIYALGADNLSVSGCTFRNLTRAEGTHSAGGTASLESDYAVLASGCDGVRFDGNTVDELSGCAFFAVLCDGVYCRANTIRMVSTFQCLYPINIDYSCDGVWIEVNRIVGGNRRSGGAINVMSIDAPNKRVYVRGNVIDGCNGNGSGTAVIRFLSVEDGEVSGNIVVNITSAGATYLLINSRVNPGSVSPPEYITGPVRNIARDNILVCGGTGQRAIEASNSHNAAVGGEDIDIVNNKCVSDGTHYFGAGIRSFDIDRLTIEGNTIHFERDGSLSNPEGISVSAIVDDMLDAVIRGNRVYCRSVALSRGIMLQGSGGNLLTYPHVAGNKVFDYVTFGVRAEATVTDLTLKSNTVRSAALKSTAFSIAAIGFTTREGNHRGGTRRGTATILSGTNEIDVATDETQTGDQIWLEVVQSGAGLGLKLVTITADTGFKVRTVTQANAAADIPFNWKIDH